MKEITLILDTAHMRVNTIFEYNIVVVLLHHFLEPFLNGTNIGSNMKYMIQSIYSVYYTHENGKLV